MNGNTPEMIERLLTNAKPFRQFDANLEIRYEDKASFLLEKDYWRVTRSFKYYVGNKEDDIWVYVPAGFLTDGASVPRPFWSIVPPWGKHGQAAVVHDFLVRELFLYVKGVKTDINRQEADRIFLEAMKVAGVNWFLRNLMYVSVSIWTFFDLGTSEKKHNLVRSFEANWEG